MAHPSFGQMPKILLIALSLVGCQFEAAPLGNAQTPVDPEELSSIELKNEDPVPPVINSATAFVVDWTAYGPTKELRIEASEDELTWVEVKSVSTSDGEVEIDPTDITLADGNLWFRVNANSQIIELGSAAVDRTPPVLGGDVQPGWPNGLYFGCGVARSFFTTATDNLTADANIVYEVIGVLPAGLSNCLNGTNSRQCTKIGLVPLPPTVSYKAIDEAGNESIGVLSTSVCG